MTDLELLDAAFRLRITDVPRYGFFIDGTLATPADSDRIAALLAGNLLERASLDPREQAIVAPTGAGLDLLGVAS